MLFAAGIVASTVANCMTSPREPYTPENFMPVGMAEERKPVEATPEETRAYLTMLFGKG